MAVCDTSAGPSRPITAVPASITASAATPARDVHDATVYKKLCAVAERVELFAGDPEPYSPACSGARAVAGQQLRFGSGQMRWTSVWT